MRKKKNAFSSAGNSSDTTNLNAKKAVPKAPASKVAKKSKAETGQYVVIDYPMEREIVTSPWYTLRLGASGPTEVSFDGKEWQSCREAAGYWWFDWSGYASGPHSIQARVCTGSDCWLRTKSRQITVVI